MSRVLILRDNIETATNNQWSLQLSLLEYNLSTQLKTEVPTYTPFKSFPKGCHIFQKLACCLSMSLIMTCTLHLMIPEIALQALCPWKRRRAHSSTDYQPSFQWSWHSSATGVLKCLILWLVNQLDWESNLSNKYKSHKEACIVYISLSFFFYLKTVSYLFPKSIEVNIIEYSLRRRKHNPTLWEIQKDSFCFQGPGIVIGERRNESDNNKFLKSKEEIGRITIQPANDYKLL